MRKRKKRPASDLLVSVTTKLSPGAVAALKEAAGKKNWTLSNAVRFAVLQWLDRKAA